MSFFLFAAVLSVAGTDVSVPFVMHNGLIIVEAEVNDTRGHFIFDTGSSDLLINGTPTLTDESFSTANGTAVSEQVRVEQINIGGLIRSNLIGFKMDLSSVEDYLAMDLAGVIGGELLFDKVIEIDFKNQRLTTKGAITDFGRLTDHSISYEMVDEVPIVEVRIGDRDYSFILDSGASCHFVDHAVVEDQPIFFTDLNSVKITTVASSVNSNKHLASSWQLGNHIATSVPMVAGEYADLLSTVQVGGLISLSALNSEIIIIDKEQQNIHF